MIVEQNDHRPAATVRLLTLDEGFGHGLEEIRSQGVLVNLSSERAEYSLGGFTVMMYCDERVSALP